MKITSAFLVAFCALSLYNPEVHAVTLETFRYTTTSALPSILDEIELQGDLMNSVGPNAIEAGANKEAVYIQFNQSVGNVDIFIYNENGQQIYCSTINTSVQQMVVIPIANITNNDFTIILNSASGSAEGEIRQQ